MSHQSVAKRYAKALFDAAQGRDALEQVEKDMALVVDVFSSSPEIADWFYHPGTDLKKKKELLSRSFEGIHVLTKNFLFVLADAHREDMLKGIVSEFKSLLDQVQGVVKAHVTSAFDLSSEDEEKLVSVFQEMLGKEIRIETTVDSDLLGGVKVKIGDRIYDGSLKTKLKRFKERVERLPVQVK